MSFLAIQETDDLSRFFAKSFDLVLSEQVIAQMSPSVEAAADEWQEFLTSP